VISSGRVGDSTADIVFKQLARYLGPSTAKTALKTFCDRSVGKPPEQVTRSDAQPLLVALKPMLRTLLGAGQCDQVLKQLQQELSI
jgi:hypothetical protein